MSIATAIAAAQQKVANAYTAVSNKGGTLPATQNLSNLPTAINSISGGVDTTGWIPRTVSNGTITQGSTFPNLTGVTKIGAYALSYIFANNQSINGSLDLLKNITEVETYGLYRSFYDCDNITSIDLRSLTKVGYYGCYETFRNSAYITSINLNSLSDLSSDNACQNMFYGCDRLTSVSLPQLVTMGYQSGYAMFEDCDALATVSFPKLETINGYRSLSYAFGYCPALTSITFPKLKTLTGSGSLYRAFYYASHLTSVSFPALTSTSFGSYTNQFNQMLSYVTGCTVHFPSNLSSIISSWSDYSSGFGGTNTTILFDLTATS